MRTPLMGSASSSSGQMLTAFNPAAIDHHHEMLEEEAERERGNQQDRGIGAPKRAEGEALAGEREHHDDQDDGADQERCRPGTDEGDCGGGGRGHDQRIAADHDEVAMGEVDQPHDAKNQPDAERGERVQAAERERVDGVLDQSGHDGPSDEEIGN